MSTIRIDKYDQLRRGLYVQGVTPEGRLQSLIQRLQPVKTQVALTRIGAAHDGGYLMPDDFHGIAACFSPGVGPTSSFEMDLQVRYGIPSHLCDYSVAAPPNNFQPASFEKKFLGALEDETFTTLNRWMERKPEFHASNDLMLQMDIEGGEYSALLAVDEDKLQRFRMIVIEFHHVEHWADPVFFNVVEAVFSKLLKHFHPVHLHLNNFGRLLELRSITVPEVFELTLLRKDRGTIQGYCEEFPHPLDGPCNPRRPDLLLPEAWRGPVLQPAAPALDNRSVFNQIYLQNRWGKFPGGMSSGPGSHQQDIVGPYVRTVRAVIQQLGCERMVDLGCGDFFVGQQILSACRLYTACDVSDVILQQNKESYRDPSLEFRNIDITADVLPVGDLAFVRQVLQHLSNRQIGAFVESLNRSKPYQYLMVTEHLPRDPNFVANADITTGPDIRLFAGSGVELDKPPFSLDYLSKKVILEVDAPVRGLPATIRTSLFELR